MDEKINDQAELIQDIPQKITEFLEYGRSNGGWNKLLDVFVLSSSWEESKIIIRRYNNERSNLLEQEIESLNNRLDKLEELSEKIVEILRKEIVEWPELENVKAKRDPGVILRALENVNFAQLTQDKKRVLDSLVRLLDEFVLEYEEWKIFRDKNLEKLNKMLKGVMNGNIVVADNKNIKSISPDPGKAIKRTKDDTGWGWGRKRGDL